MSDVLFVILGLGGACFSFALMLFACFKTSAEADEQAEMEMRKAFKELKDNK